MSRTATVADIRNRALRATDHENDSFISVAEAADVISTAYALYQAELRDTHPGYVAEATPDEWTANGSARTLPSTFVRLISIEYKYDSAPTWIDIPEAHPASIAEYSGPISVTYADAYRMDGETIVLLPAVTSGTYRARHFAASAKFTSASDASTVDGIDGWEQLLVEEVKVYIRNKEEADARQFLLERDRVLTFIREAAARRVMNKPGRIRDADCVEYPHGGRYGRRTRRYPWA